MARRERGRSLNILHSLRARELGGDPLATGATTSNPLGAHRAATRQLGVWAEASFLKHASGSYAELQHSPRSTIAVAFSPEGSLIASTHGDHTVKIVDSRSAQTLRVMEGHLRTPWVVRFNPRNPDIVASGSLDYRVSMWRASTGECLHQHNFGRPIASIAFHSYGSHVAVASGHKVYVWPYREGPASQPAVVLKTRKSLRALHFHPHGLPILLTAEVVERKSSSNSATGGSVAGVPGQPEPSESAPQPPLPLPPLPTPSAPIDIPGAGLQPQQREPGPSPVTRPPVSQPIAISVGGAGASQRPWVPTASAQPHVGSVGSRPELNITHSSYRLVSLAASPPGSSPPLITRLPPSRFAQASQARSLGTAGTPPGAAHVPAANHGNTSTTTSGWVGPMLQPDGGHQTTQPPLLGHWDRQWMGAPQHIPFAPQPTPTAQPPITGAAPAATGGAPRSVPWPISGQDSQAGAPQQALSAAASAAVPTVPGGPAASALRAQLQASTHPGVAQFNSSTGAGEVGPTFGGQQQQHHHQEQRQAPPPHEQQPPQPSMLMPLPTQSLGSAYAPAWGWEVSPQASLQVMASLRERHTLRLEHQLPLAGSTEGEQPCIVSLTIWPFAESQPGRPLTKPAFNIPRAVLCSEMGTSFSPCGRYLAVCVISDKPSQACAAWLQQQQSSSPQAPLVQESLAGGGQQGTQAGANTSTGHGPSRSSASGQGTSAAAEQQPSVDVSHSCTSSASSSPTCELRVYAVWGPRFGEVLAARPIRAADCLTSLQFSPTSEHLLVGYGRRHISLCTLLVDGDGVAPVHTILEVYRVSDMRLVRLLPSLDDEVNCATWSPVPGEGIVYGTKEGKLRMLRHDRRPPERLAIPRLAADKCESADQELWEAERRAANASGTEDD